MRQQPQRGGRRHGLTKEAGAGGGARSFCKRGGGCGRWPGRAERGPGGGLRRRSTPATGRSGGRSATKEPDFVRRARDVTGTMTMTEPKRRAVGCSAQVCARRGTTPRNHRPAPPSRHTPESRRTQAHTCQAQPREVRSLARRSRSCVTSPVTSPAQSHDTYTVQAFPSSAFRR